MLGKFSSLVLRNIKPSLSLSKSHYFVKDLCESLFSDMAKNISDLSVTPEAANLPVNRIVWIDMEVKSYNYKSRYFQLNDKVLFRKFSDDWTQHK